MRKRRKSKLQKRRENPYSALWRNKADRLWKETVAERWGRRCAVCGGEHNLQAHHLIPREMASHRHEPANGILLCASHHRFSFELSAHHAPMAFAQWLCAAHPSLWAWLSDQQPKREPPKSYQEIYEMFKQDA